MLETKGIGELVCGHFVVFYRFLKPIIWPVDWSNAWVAGFYSIN